MTELVCVKASERVFPVTAFPKHQIHAVVEYFRATSLHSIPPGLPLHFFDPLFYNRTSVSNSTPHILSLTDILKLSFSITLPLSLFGYLKTKQNKTKQKKHTVQTHEILILHMS